MTEAFLTSVLSLCVAVLFYRAGRALAAEGATRGSWVPWAVLVVVPVLPFFFFQAFIVPTGSMENTLLIGDRIIVQRRPAHQPQYGEIMALVYPIDRRQTFVKRIVGIPGDHIRFSHKALYRNGALTNEPWVVHKADYEDLYRDNFPAEPTTALFPPAAEMLARNWGFVSETDFIGRAVVIYDSEDESAEQASGTKDQFHHGPTRWDRLFRML